MDQFKSTFSIPKPNEFETYNDPISGRTKYIQKKFTWNDQQYREFMMEILTNLEPRMEKKGHILFEELEEVCEVIFVSNGWVDIGYEINKQKKYIIRDKDSIMVGAYNCCHNMRTMFIYKCQTDCSGYSIRKSNWNSIMDNFPEIAGVIIKNCT